MFFLPLFLVTKRLVGQGSQADISIHVLSIWTANDNNFFFTIIMYREWNPSTRQFGPYELVSFIFEYQKSYKKSICTKKRRKDGCGCFLEANRKISKWTF